MKFFKYVTAVLMAVFLANISFVVNAVTPSKQQIEQFKKLPQSQQKLLARQYGIDLGATLQSDNSEEKPVDTNNNNMLKKSNEDKDFLSSEEKRFKPELKELHPFGYETFSDVDMDVQSFADASIPSGYILGIGDELKVTLFGQESLVAVLKIDKSGRISIPGLQPVTISGMSYQDASALLKDKVSSELIGTSIYLTLENLKNIRVMIVGEVNQPGSYNLPSLSTITSSIYRSGGLTDIGSFRNIKLTRNNSETFYLDLYDVLLKGSTQADIELKSGDTIFVPHVRKQVGIEGAVRRSGLFELKGNESIQDLLNMAGGFQAQAYKELVQVTRYEQGAQSVLSVDAVDYENVQLKDGDRLAIAESSKNIRNSITLIGAVVRPGKYAWQEGLSVKNLIGEEFSNLLPQADKNYGLVVRGSAFKETSVLQFNLKDELLSKSELKLAPQDKVYIFSEFELKKYEDATLAALDLTEQELKKQEESKLWNLYEQELFKAFVDTSNLEALNGDSQIKNKAKIQDLIGDSLFSISSADNKFEETLSPFSRAVLLEPILKKLKRQATPQSPYKFVTVQGHVKFPGNYPIEKNYNIKKAIEAAGGLLESAYLEKAELTSYVVDNKVQVIHKSILLKDELQSPIAKLKSKDNLNILPTPQWKDENQVTIKGEVKFPGVYTIKRAETLTNLVERAGGFTDQAAINGAVFTRKEIKEQEEKQIKRLSENLQREIASKSIQPASKDIVYAEVKGLLSDLEDVEALGRLIVDLPKILNGKQELILQDGDQLIIPPKRDSISIIGEVNFPSNHLYEANLDLENYLDKSGGFKEMADEERLYIIKANGSVIIPDSSWFAVTDSVDLEPGDTIVVPLQSNYLDTLTLWQTSTQIIYQIGVAMAAISSI